MRVNRRGFLAQSLTLAALSPGCLIPAAAAQTQSCDDQRGNFDLRAESMYFQRIRHHHQYTIPFEVLRTLPAEGYTVRTSQPLAGKTDAELGRIGLGEHSHPVTLSREQLELLTMGREVNIEVLNPEGKLAHRFCLCLDDRILEQLRK